MTSTSDGSRMTSPPHAEGRKNVLAIDLGGTKALAGLVARDGSVSSRVWLSSRDLVGRPAELLDRLANGAHQAAREAGVADAAVSALGICVPGPLDQSRSVVSLAPNLGWREP